MKKISGFVLQLVIIWTIIVQAGYSQQVNKMEYFVDTDPGFGNGTDIPVTASPNISNLAVAVNISSVSNGFHTIYIRSKDDNGGWSFTNHYLFLKQAVAATQVNKMEYFVDTDPGFGNGTDIPVTASPNISNLAVAVNISSLSDGFHTLFIRSKDDKDSWSITNHYLFFKEEARPNVQRGEYFFDTDPGFGNGTAIPYSGSLSTDVPDFAFAADINALGSGSHHLFIRTQDLNGRWSLTNVLPFTRNFPLPVTLINFTAKADGSKALLEWQTATEINNDRFEIERSDNGTTFSVIGQVAGAGNSSILLNYRYIDANPFKENNYYRLRQVDLDGRFNYSPTRLVNFNRNTYFVILNNPPSGAPIIVKTTETNATLSIFDETGKKIKDLPMSGNNISIPVDQLSSGIYLLVLHKEGAVKAAEKFVVNR